MKYRKVSKSNDKITFLVNSSSYYRYLFRYGLKETNYRIINEKDSFVIYFVPPTDEDPTRLLEMKSSDEAHKKVEELIQYLKNINAGSEGFHIMEHVLLRPLDGNECHFLIKGKANEALFKSVEPQHEELQNANARDTLLLACYSNNYKILQNQDKEYVVIIKNGVGRELAKSINTFITEISAQKFIDECQRFFNEMKESNTFKTYYELENQKEYFFELLDEKDEVFLWSFETSDIKQQEKKTEEIPTLGMNPNNYKLGSGKHNITVLLVDFDNKEIAQSREKFDNPDNAEEFISKCVGYFENLIESKSYKSIIRYQRVGGRNSNEFNSRLSVIYSDWTARFHNQEFLQLFKQTFFNCTPAHISVNFVGLNYNEMKAFEKLYFQYMKEIADTSIEKRSTLVKLSNGILDILIDKDL